MYEEAMSEIDFESIYDEAMKDMDEEEIMDINDDLERLSCFLIEINDDSISNNNATEVSISSEENNVNTEAKPSNTVSKIEEERTPQSRIYIEDDPFFEDMTEEEIKLFFEK